MTAHQFIIEFTTWFILVYFIVLNIVYLFLNVISISTVRRSGQESILEDMPQVYSALEPSVSILIPAFNEEATIAESVRSMLQLSYSRFEIIVINDGSTDRTLAALRHAFGLLPFPETYHIQIQTKAINGIFRSARYPNLHVIDKVNGGKADCLNAGINLSRYPLFCGVDADSILQRDSLQRVVKPFLRDPNVIAAGGTVRVANGCDISGGFMTKVRLPKNFLALLQVVEYLRAFLFGRMGWSTINGMLIISGAFGIFKKDAVIMAGGYHTGTIGEDMELVVRLHRLFRKWRIPYRIEFLPDPICWTEAPEDLRTLWTQRIRWQRGLAESLTTNWGLMFSRNGGVPGWLTFPFMLLFELFGPLIEFGGYIFMVFAFLLGWLSWPAFAIFLFVAIALGILLSISGLLLEEMSFHIYPRGKYLVWMALVAVVENFGYRQMNSLWRLIGLFLWAVQVKATWGEMKRRGRQLES